MLARVLGDRTPAQFLADYWRKKPLRVRSAWPNFHDPLTPEELAGLACEDGVEAQLVLQGNDATSEEIRHGPFTDDDFLKLPDSHWILWVRDIEKQVPDLAALLEPFRFIPDWQCDGLTLSYAMPPVTVSPCVNEDDRFLWQGQGRHCWQTSTPQTDADFSASTDPFIPDQEWILEPGDLLYLPAGVRYRGTVLEPGLSYAVNFHTPSHHELLSSFLEFLLEDLDSDARHPDFNGATLDNPGEIHATALDQARAVLRRSIALDDETLAIWFGRTLSKPKAKFHAEPEQEPYSAEELRGHLRTGGSLQRNPGSRFYYIAGLEDEALLFVDGQEFALGTKVAFIAPLLCQHRVLAPTQLREALKQADARQLLLDLVNEGYLVIYEEEDIPPLVD